MIDLETALLDLGDHLDHPDGDHLVEHVVDRLAEPAPLLRPRHRSPRAPLALAAAVVLALLVALLAFAPAREAIAQWFGIGTIEIHRSGAPTTAALPGPVGVPGSVGATGPSIDLADAQRQVTFPIRVPRGKAAPTRAEVDAGVPGGLVALTFADYTIVEIATTDRPPAIGKGMGPGTKLTSVTVNGQSGYFINGAPHEIGYLDRNGNYRTDTVRRSGDVLLWQDGGVTYRVEGLDLDGARGVAEAMR